MDRVTRIVQLSEQAHTVISGMIAQSDEVNVDGILANEDVWNEIRKEFPLSAFHEGVSAGLIGYDEDAGT